MRRSNSGVCAAREAGSGVYAAREAGSGVYAAREAGSGVYAAREAGLRKLLLCRVAPRSRNFTRLRPKIVVDEIAGCAQYQIRPVVDHVALVFATVGSGTASVARIDIARPFSLLWSMRT